MQTPNSNTANDKYNESEHSQYVVLVRNCSLFDLRFTHTKVSNNNDDHVSTS